ncbi:peptidoglycan-binding domain-containing protein [uncultured Metabacillus sp.]|uniref:peptidoglycan-binding domain-containing protein n=1 Tax=uncultured Metabacillus sp. TaxID=2860135 RepID=UPI0034587463
MQPTSASAHHSNNFANFPTVQSGSSGEYVEFLQAFLYTAGYYNGSIDGIFGSGTRSAVIAFQNNRGLSADGIVGDGTWNSI